jgi:hypothetical protein
MKTPDALGLALFFIPSFVIINTFLNHSRNYFLHSYLKNKNLLTNLLGGKKQPNKRFMWGNEL